MPTYIILANFTDQRTFNISDSPKRADVSRLETSSALASRRGDARCRPLDLASAPLADW
jgi:hypothetical protein